MLLPGRCLGLALSLGVAVLAGACSPASDAPGAGGSAGQGGEGGKGGNGNGGTSAGGSGGRGGSPGGAGGSGGASSTGGTGGSAGTGGSGGSGGAPSTGGTGGSAGTGGSGGASGGSGGNGGSPAPADGGAREAAPGDGATEAPPTGGPPSAAAVPSPACAGTAMVPGPNGNQTFMDRGKNRSFIIRMPTNYDGKKPLPIFFAFHGAGGGASAFEGGVFGGISRMIADRAVRVFPQSFGGNTWSRDENDDVLYMDAVMEWLKTRVCYDTARVYASGQSSGAYFSHRWACDRGSVVRAVATNSGGQRRERALDCKTPVSSWTSTGLGDNPGHVMGTRQARDVWAKLAGCMTSGATPVMPSPCVSLPGCRAGYKVHHCEHSGGHAVPGYASGAIVNFLFGPNAP